MVLDTSKLSDEQLAAEAAREGSDGPAFTTLLERYQERVWRVCYRLMGEREDAADAAQEVFVRLFLNRAKFQGRSKYSTWVYGVAMRTCLSIRRGRGRQRRREQEVRERDREKTISSMSGSELSLDLSQMLESLDEEDRAMLILKYAEGYSYDELSEMFTLSVSACKMRISRAREKLKIRYPEQNF